MEEGELYAIETFGSINGKGYVWEDGDCSHYMKSINRFYLYIKIHEYI
jgi:methionyl aminopeptidase